MGKSDAVLDILGWRLDTRPRPQLYVGPSKDFITDQFEPRVMQLLDEAPNLKDKVARGKRLKKTRKVIAGVPLRLAWAGSATQLSSDQAGDIYVDELDRMDRSVEGEGDPLSLAKARGFTYGAGSRIMVTSTPKEGAVEIEPNPDGLEFWAVAEKLSSPIWRLWQTGTRHHWAWPCPHCAEYFIPRMKLLCWPEGASADKARREAWVLCPRCGGCIYDPDKLQMNARGVYVAPGQRIENGRVVGDPPIAMTLSFWVSGLASPFVSWGARAAALVEAQESGEPETVKAVINTGFGELFAPGGGEVPAWTEVAAKRAGYKRGEMPSGVVYPVLTVDVQKNRFVWVIRGWGARATSWLIDHGSIYGETIETEVWQDLATLLTDTVCGVPIRICLIDSGFRPGKPDQLPINRVYEFCRRFPRQVRATRGSTHPMRTPLITSRIEVKSNGKASEFGLEQIRLDTDYFKSWVHERVRWPEDQPGAWHLPADADDDYCHQIVSEARVKHPSGRVEWVERSKNNHALDCESMQAGAAFLLGMQRMTAERAASVMSEREGALIDEPQRAREPEPPQRGNDWLPSTGSDWLQVPRNWF